jgi:hypothetical protein
MKNSFKTPLVPISWGELIDKITILEIKLKRLNSHDALQNVKNEYEYLSDIVKSNFEIEEITTHLKKNLLTVNELLWQVEDDIRDKEFNQSFDQHFIELARKVYHLNDQRAFIKKQINKDTKSELVEEKGYKKYSN